MKIEHIAIWVRNLNAQISFYQKWFRAIPGDIYQNPAKKFTSCFLTLNGEARLELMHHEDIADKPEFGKEIFGWAHLAISVGSKTDVDFLTQEMEQAGIKIVSRPRTTGDGYYESVIRDPEENLVEITI